MKELLLTRGLPASGKTTWARKWVAEAPESRARINRDDLRQLLFGRDSPLSRELESAVSSAQKAAVTGLLAAGKSVVIDNMHLRRSYIRDWASIANQAGAQLVVNEEFLAIPVDVLVNRDKQRRTLGERHVGEDFIREMAQRYKKIEPWVPDPVETYVYEPDTSLPRAWMMDIDGTLALMKDRGPFDWHKVGNDDVNGPVVHLMDALIVDNYKIVLMSGRDSVCRPQTLKWLKYNQMDFHALFMRPEGDTRKDSIVKIELFKEHVAPNYWVEGVLDDRNQVVDAWRSIGLFCAQVAPGAF